MVLQDIRGFLVTLRHFFQRPVTIQYPEQKREQAPRFRGSRLCALIRRLGRRFASPAGSVRGSARRVAWKCTLCHRKRVIVNLENSSCVQVAACSVGSVRRSVRLMPSP